MRRLEGTWGARGVALVAGIAVASALAGCGQRDFLRDPSRPPMPLEVTGVITSDQVTVSPNRVGGGSIVLSISNQDDASHTVVFEGDQVREEVGPINPQDTATFQVDVSQGVYTVRAGSERASTPGERIKPAMLFVGARRPTGEDDLLRP